MTTLLHDFIQDEQGQDLIEYTLLLAFVCLASAALFISAGGSVGGIWSATNSRLAAADTSASWIGLKDVLQLSEAAFQTCLRK